MKNSDSENDDDLQANSMKKKKDYQKPRLEELGTLRQMTTGGSSTAAEDSQTDPANKRP
jgi:hypothetical protein